MNKPSYTPPGVGPASDEHRAVCVYTGVTPDGPRCGAPATTHVLVESARSGMAALASCGGHRGIAVASGVLLDEHPFAGVCGLPGTVWSHRPVSRCAIDDSGTEPDRSDVASPPEAARA